MTDVQAIKYKSKLIAAQPGARTLLISAIYFLITYLISFLIMELTGYSQYLNDEIKALTEVMSGGEYVPAPWPVLSPASYVLAGAVYLMSLLLQVGWEGWCLTRSRGFKADFRSIFDVFNFFGKALLISVVRGLLILVWSVPGAVILGVETSLGLFGIIGLAVTAFCCGRVYLRYRLAFYFMYDNDELSAIGCLRASKDAVTGKLKELIRLYLTFAIWYIIPWFVPIANIMAYPVTGIGFAEYYNIQVGRSVEVGELKDRDAELPENSEEVERDEDKNE